MDPCWIIEVDPREMLTSLYTKIVYLFIFFYLVPRCLIPQCTRCETPTGAAELYKHSWWVSGSKLPDLPSPRTSPRRKPSRFTRIPHIPQIHDAGLLFKGDAAWTWIHVNWSQVLLIRLSVALWPPWKKKRSRISTVIEYIALLGCLLSLRCLVTLGIGCLIRSHLLFYLALHFNVLGCRSLYLPATVSPDCSGNSALPVCNETGQRLEQLNRRDNQSLIQTAMQNIQAIPSEIVLSGILDFRLHLINLGGRRQSSLMDLDKLGKERTCGHRKTVSFLEDK